MALPAPIFPRFSAVEYQRRYALVRAEMRKRGLDAVVAAGDSAFRNSNHANVYWLTNWLDPYAAYAVIPLDGEPFLVISNKVYIHNARRAAVVDDVFGTFTPGRAIGERLCDLGLVRGRIGLAGVRNVGRASMASEHHRDLLATMPQASFEDGLEVLQSTRLIKSAEEIAWFEKGAEFTDRAIDAIAQTLRPGMPEYELSAHIQASFLPDGGSLMFHFLGATPMNDPEFIFPWQYPSARVIERGDVLMPGWGITIEPPRADLPGAMIKRELAPFTVEPGMLLVVQPHLVSEDGKRGVQVGNLVACDGHGARSLQRTPMRFFETAEPC